MIGGYIRKEFSDYEIDSLGRSYENEIVADLRQTSIALTGEYDTVIHCAGTTLSKLANAVNFQGTINLLKALEKHLPRHVVFISSLSVYGKTEGEEITEDSMLVPVTEYGISKLNAEKELQSWCNQNNVVLTILRPALTFGNGLTGKAQELFDAIVRGRYFHVRGNTARRSVVMADDVAKACRLLLHKGGTYNVTDGRNHTVIELADAMAQNYGQNKRIVHCPIGLLKVGAKLGDIIPGVAKLIDSEKLKTLTSTLTFSNQKIADATGIEFYDTVEVIARRAKDYPYEYND